MGTFVRSYSLMSKYGSEARFELLDITDDSSLVSTLALALAAPRLSSVSFSVSSKPQETISNEPIENI